MRPAIPNAGSVPASTSGDPSPPSDTTPYQAPVAVSENIPGSLKGADQLYLDPDRLLERFGMQPGGKPVSRARLLVFDDYMKSASGKNLVTESNPLLDNVLGMFDQLAIHVVAGDALVGGTQPLTLSVLIQHSADGLNWLDKRPGTPEIPAQQILLGAGATPATVTLTPGYDDGSTPSLALVRLRLNLKTTGAGSAAPVSAKIKIHVTCNDRRETTFIAKQEHKWSRRVHRVQTKQEQAQKAHQAAVAHAAKVSECAREYLALRRLDPEFAGMVRTQCQTMGVGLDEMMEAVTKQARAAAERNLAHDVSEMQRRLKRKKNKR